MLPNTGGIFQQDEEDIKKLIVIYGHLDQARKDDIDKANGRSD